ncbi:PI-PLC X domain-containing protein At5g67130-like [Rhododendron vialii]|uniref:PI-PLC X domain-containing protein At5g67130-like n=1 Tax=Rhododendron vialii TaxID=182163 RepID=UPI00265EF3F6|nr:PI-PLC X domain-containing protein At5g67130-like [Rhododendron vialii]
MTDKRKVKKKSFHDDELNAGSTFSNPFKIVSGVRALILKIQSVGNGARDVWICQQSTDWDNNRSWWDSYTPALELLEEIERFLSSNPFEILTLILEDCVGASNGLVKVFEAARLTKYLFPLKKMPRNGGDWPSVKDMAAANQRLIVFTSNISKEESEGIAYTWNFMVECKCEKIDKQYI